MRDACLNNAASGLKPTSQQTCSHTLAYCLVLDGGVRASDKDLCGCAHSLGVPHVTPEQNPRAKLQNPPPAVMNQCCGENRRLLRCAFLPSPLIQPTHSCRLGD